MALNLKPGGGQKVPTTPQTREITPETPPYTEGDTSIAGDKAAADAALAANAATQTGPDVDVKSAPGSPEAIVAIKAEVEAGKQRRPYTKPDLSSFTLDTVTAAPLEAEELADVPRITKDADRSPVQLAVDAQYADAYTAWEAAGKPTVVRDCYEHDRKIVLEFKAKGEEAPFTQLVVRRFFLDPAQEAGFRVLIRKAAEVHGHGVKILPIATHQSGRHMLVWMPRDVKERTEEAKAKLAATRKANKAKKAAASLAAAQKVTE